MTTAYDVARMLTHFPVPGASVPTPIENPSAERARTRRDAADRKRRERAKRRDAGLPDPRSVDSALAQALATVIMRAGIPARIREQGSMDFLNVTLKQVVGEAMAIMVEGRNIPAAGARQALVDRLGLAA
ncbi:hypothetical protein [Methylobacterium flocculans]|uniref:hypothetical protein n=1 Tax=Methylobacterium flocculans TaxID=2984843 RepID=UPI0021F38120|nr:hypothetical protein [Methylobacterium sp. FF17]